MSIAGFWASGSLARYAILGTLLPLHLRRTGNFREITVLLIDQVHLLRRNITRLKSFRVCLPLLGGVHNVRETYEFIHLLHPARDIVTSIKRADPFGNKLHGYLRGWNLNVKDDHGNATIVDLKDLLGRLVHVYYLRLDGEVLDVSNDWGNRIIVPYPSFLKAISRLALSPVDVALVSCHLARNVHVDQLRSLSRSKGQSQPFRFPPDSVPGTGDFSRLLWDIRTWPQLMDAVWDRFFKTESKPLEADADVIDNRPFSQGRRLERNGDYKWSIGWRRGPVISKIDVDPLSLIDFVRIRFEAMAVPKPD